MKIFITCPNPKNPHGGLRVIFQWAEWLSKHHTVHLHLLGGSKPNWYNIKDSVDVNGFSKFQESDVVILTSPHSADFLDLILPKQKCFLFLQMAENMFKPDDVQWFRLCKKFYQAPYKMFYISKWMMEYLNDNFHRNSFCGRDHYLHNGIDFDQFPIIKRMSEKSMNTILIEGIEPGNNPTKDVDRIAARVGRRLLNDGYIVYAYSQSKPDYNDCFTTHFAKPSLPVLNELYTVATILIKASKYDCRSLSPLEAMTKGTPTVRAIIQGDDDLITNLNAIRVGYDEDKLYGAAVSLLKNTSYRTMLSMQCISYVQNNCDWDNILPDVLKIIS